MSNTCKICEGPVEIENRPTGMCDYCWYGMRLDAKNWIKDLKARGIEVEQGIGCNPIPRVGFVCGDPYRRKREAPADEPAEKAEDE